MKHRFLMVSLACLFALLLWPVGLDAQTASLSKQINNIKRDNKYIFAEATCKTSDEATEAANLLLEKYINEYIESKAKLDNANSVVVKDVMSSCEKIEVPRGSMVRVFVYVKKSNIEPAQNVTTITQEERNQPAVEMQSTVETIEETPETPEVVENTTPTVENVSTTVESVSSAVDNATVNTYVVQDASLAAWQQRLVSEIVEQPTLIDVHKKLNTFRVQNKVKRFGPASRPCLTPEEAFYVYADASGNVTAVIGRQDSGRINYMTGQKDSVEAHSSELYMWFTLNK